MPHGSSGGHPNQHYQTPMQPPAALHHQQPMPTMLANMGYGIPPGMGYAYPQYAFPPNAYYMHSMYNPHYAGPAHGAAYPPQAGNVTNTSPYNSNQQGAVPGGPPNGYGPGANFAPPGYGGGGNQSHAGGSRGGSSGGKVKSGMNSGFSTSNDIYGNGNGNAAAKEDVHQPQSGFNNQPKDSSSAPPTHQQTHSAPMGYSQGNMSSFQGYGASQSNGQAHSQQYGAQNAQYMQYSAPNMIPPGMGQSQAAGNGGASMLPANNGYKLGFN